MYILLCPRLLLMILLLGLGPLGLRLGGVGQLLDFVEDGRRQTQSDEPVLPDPLVVDVPLERELGDLGREGVGKLHGTTHGSSGVRHRA